MGEGIGESEIQELVGPTRMSLKKETKGADSRDKVQHTERSNQLFLERMMKVAEQE